MSYPPQRAALSRSRCRSLRIESLEGRQLLSALPLGADPRDTAEFMLGSVAVTPVLLESNGQVDPSTENWTSAEISQVLENLRTGVQWWTDSLAALSSSHALEFLIDDTFASTPVATPYEPINNRSDAHVDYVGRFLADQGYGGGTTLEGAMLAFNNDQRLKLGTDWAYTVFVVDSSADDDKMFATGGSFRQAFGFAGGLFFVTPSSRPASTYTHETGHMFWARDEYSGGGRWSDRRGYYDAQNANAVDGAPEDFIQQPSIMSSGLLLQEAYNTHTSAAATFAQIGWRDSDADGVFDVLDVPLSLDLDGVYLESTRTLQLRGRAAAVPLPNANSSGLGNDITLNRISRIEYRVDGGSWIVASRPDQQEVDVDLAIPIASNLSVVEIRAVDAATGITSNNVRVAAQRPTGGGRSIDGFAFLDNDGNSLWDDSEALISGVTVSLVDPSGVFRGRVEPDDRSGTIYPVPLDGIRIESFGNQVDGRVAAFEGTAATGKAGFFYGSVFGTWGDSWTKIKQELKITLPSSTSDASIIAVAKEPHSFARLEGYSADGQLVARDTAGPLGIGQTATLRVHDPAGRIASIRAFGHAGTSVALDDFRYGPAIAATSGTFGTVSLSDLPEGTYTLLVESSSPQYRVLDPNPTVQVAGSAAAPLGIALERATSRWMNPNNPFDVNNNGVVQPLDALVVINELNRSHPRLLAADAPAPPYFDVNGDLSVTPIDALQVINYLNRLSSLVQQSAGELSTESGVNSGAVAGAFWQLGTAPDWGVGNSARGAEGESGDDSWASGVDAVWESLGRRAHAGDSTASGGERVPIISSRRTPDWRREQLRGAQTGELPKVESGGQIDVNNFPRREILAEPLIIRGL